MLTRSRLLAVLALAAGMLLGSPLPLLADGGQCDKTSNPWCSADGSGSGSPGGNGGSSGGSGCTWQGQTVPCTDPDFGYYTGGGCYWKAYDPQPVHPPPNGQDPNKGK